MMKNLNLISIVFASLLMSGAQVSAGSVKSKPLGVVELFTSQGCSSCPPADEVLSRLVKEGDVIALSYHVDYWNYLGWEDTLSSKASTNRQYQYAQTLKRRGVYTPQAVINGRNHIVGSDYSGIKDQLADYEGAGQAPNVPIEITKNGDELTISVGNGQGHANVIVVYFDRENMIDIKRGENRGRTITYHHSVSDLQTIGMWHGQAQEFHLPLSMLDNGKPGGCAILLQSMTASGTPSAILGATHYES